MFKKSLFLLLLSITIISSGLTSYGSTLTCDFSFDMEWVPDLYNWTDVVKGKANCFNRIAADKPTVSYKIDKITTINNNGKEIRVDDQHGSIYHPDALDDNGLVLIKDWLMPFMFDDTFTVYKTSAEVAEVTGGMVNYPMGIIDTEFYNDLAKEKIMGAFAIPYRSLKVYLSEVPLVDHYNR